MSRFNVAASPIFVSLVCSDAGMRSAQFMIESIRTFGGDLCDSPIWLFETRPNARREQFNYDDVDVIALDVPEAVSSYEFGGKVYACAQAEALAPANATSLIWIDPTCLVVQPPLLFNLGGEFDAALRPVHIRNVGSPACETPDAYWKWVYKAVGVEDIATTVESFVDRQRVRAYFNTHAFSINPQRRLMKRWLEVFGILACDQEFQASACSDEEHRIFLHQAVFSTLVATAIKPQRICHLPPTYNYPYHLHSRVPMKDRPQYLDDLICFAYEDYALAPHEVDDIGVREPLKSWLLSRHR